jgi:hypothetical protein
LNRASWLAVPREGQSSIPFGGAGTTGLVADRLGRNAVLIELNPDYAAMAERRIKGDFGMFAEVVTDASRVVPDPQQLELVF